MPAIAEKRPSLESILKRIFRFLLIFLAISISVSLIRLFVLLQVSEGSTAQGIEALQALKLAHDGMLDQETGLRGYLLSGDEEFLAPYRRGRGETGRGNDILASKLESTPLTDEFLKMRIAQQRWTSEWGTAAAAAPAVPGSDPSFLERGKQLFDQYRAREDALSNGIEQWLADIQSRSTWILVVGAGMQIAILVALLPYLSRTRVRLDRQLVRPMHGLLRDIERIEEGELAIAADIREGTLEIEELQTGLAEMAAALSEQRNRDEAREAEIAFQAATLKKLLTLSREVSSSLDLEGVVHAITASATSLTGWADSSVWLVDEIDGIPAVLVRYGTDRKEASLSEGPRARAIRFGRSVVIGPDGERFSTDHEKDLPIRTILCPMIAGGTTIGLLEVHSEEPLAISPALLGILLTLAGQAGSSLEAALLHQKTQELSDRDALTQLLNRRRLDVDLPLECSRAARHSRPLSVVMLDIDHFKAFNDSLGHQAGDDLLRDLARIIDAEVRDTDRAYRYGGEEFTLVLPETNADAGLRFAERLREGIQTKLQDRGDGVTASMGLASAEGSQTTARSLLGSADKALYDAKRSGRNRVVQFKPSRDNVRLLEAHEDES